MGILKNILNAIVSSVQDELTQPKKTSPGPASQPASRPSSKPTSSLERNATHRLVTSRSYAEWHQYFKEILTTDFPQYTISENVPVTDLAGFAADEFQLYSTRPRQVYKAEWGQPYSFVMVKDGTPKGVVMIGSGHCHDSNVKFLIARMYAKKLGLPYINFYLQMPNERAYVIQRVNSFLHF